MRPARPERVAHDPVDPVDVGLYDATFQGTVVDASITDTADRVLARLIEVGAATERAA